MSLTSASTFQEALDQYNNNLGWRADRNKAILALEAVDYMLMNRPRSAGSDGGHMSYEDLRGLQQELAAIVKQGSSNRSPFVRAVMNRP